MFKFDSQNFVYRWYQYTSTSSQYSLQFRTRYPRGLYHSPEF